MASGEVLIKLFKAFKENNEVAFTKVAYEIIEEEKKKNHNLLATKLYRILFDDNFTLNINKNKHINEKQLPVDKETGLQLLEMKFSKTTLDDIILTSENREKINNIIFEFKNKDILSGYRLVPKTRILFCGPPGCGKTITAEAIANELQIPLLYSRFDSIISSFLGETSANLRKVFDFSKNGEWVLFFDEFDAIGKSRDNFGEHSELKRVVNSFLQIIDGYPKDSIVVAATNYETMIDKALWRRFDEIVYFGKPNTDEIKKIIQLNLRNFRHKELDINIHLDSLIGSSYADIERICVEAMKKCILNSINSINNDIFKEIIEKEIMRKELIINSSN